MWQEWRITLLTMSRSVMRELELKPGRETVSAHIEWFAVKLDVRYALAACERFRPRRCSDDSDDQDPKSEDSKPIFGQPVESLTTNRLRMKVEDVGQRPENWDVSQGTDASGR